MASRTHSALSTESSFEPGSDFLQEGVKHRCIKAEDWRRSSTPHSCPGRAMGPSPNRGQVREVRESTISHEPEAWWIQRLVSCKARHQLWGPSPSEGHIQEIRAYILLRQSVLSWEEKKRVIMDCKGDLTYESVRNSIRLLGSKCFQDLQGQAKIRTKTYDTNVAHESTEVQSTFTSEIIVEEIDEEQVFQVLWEQGDPDAAFIHDFEKQIIDTLQESSEMANCFSAYQDARARLRERARNRGFWPSKFNSGFKQKKGNSKGKKGKGFHRQTLAERIATSACKICDQVGRWKRERPLRGQESTGQAQANSEMITMTEDLDSEQVQELSDELPEGALDMMTQVGKNFESCKKSWHDLRECELEDKQRHERLDFVRDEFCFWVEEKKTMSQMSVRLSECCRKHGLTSSCSRPTSPSTVCQPSESSSPFWCVSCRSPSKFRLGDMWGSHHWHGESRVDALINAIGGHVKRVNSSCVFRFGNNGTLQSQFALLFARRKQGWLRVEVVPGTTPFLISNRVLKGLRCMVDSYGGCLRFHGSRETVPLREVRKNLICVPFKALLNFQGQSEECLQTEIVDDLPKSETTEEQKNKAQAMHDTANDTDRIQKIQKFPALTAHQHPEKSGRPIQINGQKDTYITGLDDGRALWGGRCDPRTKSALGPPTDLQGSARNQLTPPMRSTAAPEWETCREAVHGGVRRRFILCEVDGQ